MKELGCWDEQLTLDALIDLMIRLDRLRRTNRPMQWCPRLLEPEATAEPMQLGQAQLHEEERERDGIVSPAASTVARTTTLSISACTRSRDLPGGVGTADPSVKW